MSKVYKEETQDEKEARWRMENHNTLRYVGIHCNCDDCDAFGCVENCIQCKASEKEVTELAGILRNIIAKP